MFGGATAQSEDVVRLQTQLYCVYAIMHDGGWRTIWQIVWILKQKFGLDVMQTSVSARLRDLRKPKFGSHDVQRDNVGAGEWRYRLLLNPLTQTACDRDWLV